MKKLISAIIIILIGINLYADFPITDSLDSTILFTEFNENRESDLTIQNKAIDLLNNTPAGATVRVSIHNLTRVDVSNALIDAYKRGVDIKIISRRENSAVNYLLTQIPKENIIINNGGAHGPRGNHNKFMIISPWVNDKEYVIFQTTASFTAIQTRQENDAIIIYNDESLFNAYLNYWNDMSNNVWDLGYYREINTTSGIRLYFFPHYEADGRTGEGDPIVDVLNTLIYKLGYDVVDVNNNKLTLNQTVSGDFAPEDITIRIAMSIWTTQRRAIARYIIALHELGADVKLLIDHTSTSNSLITMFEEAEIPFAGLSSLHSKQMLISFPTNNYLVFTGTANFTRPALRHRDETILLINNNVIFEQYITNWDLMWNNPDTIQQP